MRSASQTPPLRHSLIEDVMAFVVGTTLCALSLLLLTHLGLITGQTAGLGVLLSYMSDWGFGPIFFVINLPFYLLAYLRMGASFTLRSFLAVGLLSLMIEILPRYISFGAVDPLVGALLAGVLAGFGLIALFRHSTSLGGMGVLALYIQDRTGFRAGWVQLIFDAVLFGVAFLVLDAKMVLYSLAGAMVVNVIIAFNHRTDRYIVR